MKAWKKPQFAKGHVHQPIEGHVVKKFAEVLRGFDDEMDILDKDQWTKRAVKEFSRLQHTLGRSFTCFSLCHSFHNRALVLNILNMSLTLCSLQPF